MLGKTLLSTLIWLPVLGGLATLAIGDARPFALHGRRVAAAGADGVRVLEAGKGELFKVLLIGKGEPWEPCGFVQGDRSHRL